MRPFFLISAFITLFLSNGAFSAETNAPIQMDEIACVHLGELSEEEFSFLLAWLDGYFNHMHGTAILSDGGLARLGKIIQDGCTTSPNGNIIELVSERTRLDALGQHP